MWKDPIVKEVRKNGACLAKGVNYNPDRFIKRLRKNQQKSRRKIVSFNKLKVTSKSK